MKTELPELPPLWSDPPPMGHNGVDARGAQLHPRIAKWHDAERSISWRRARETDRMMLSNRDRRDENRAAGVAAPLV